MKGRFTKFVNFTIFNELFVVIRYLWRHYEKSAKIVISEMKNNKKKNYFSNLKYLVIPLNGCDK